MQTRNPHHYRYNCDYTYCQNHHNHYSYHCYYCYLHDWYYDYLDVDSLFIQLSFNQSTYLTIYMTIHLPIYLFISLSIYSTTSLSVYLSVCLSICLYNSPYFPGVRIALHPSAILACSSVPTRAFTRQNFLPLVITLSRCLEHSLNQGSSYLVAKTFPSRSYVGGCPSYQVLTL